MTKSDNTHGNPYHDEGGKFTSADDVGGNENAIDEKLKQSKEGSVDLNNPPLSLKPNISAEVIKKQMMDMAKLRKLPFTRNAEDIVDNIETFFPERLVREIDKIYDASKSCAYNHCFFKFSDGTEGKKVNLFVQILSKYRYGNIFCKTIEREEYDRILNLVKTEGSGPVTPLYDFTSGRYDSNTLNKIYADSMKQDGFGCGYALGYRGVSFNYDNAWKLHLKECLDSYIGEFSTQPCYGSQGCYGTVNYVAASEGYAEDYDGYHGHVMKHIIDMRNANILTQSQASDIQRRLTQNIASITSRVEKHLQQYLDPNRAHEIAIGFAGSIRYDLGMSCVLSGADLLACGLGNGNQLDILNWGIARILKDW